MCPDTRIVAFADATRLTLYISEETKVLNPYGPREPVLEYTSTKYLGR